MFVIVRVVVVVIVAGVIVFVVMLMVVSVVVFMVVAVAVVMAGMIVAGVIVFFIVVGVSGSTVAVSGAFLATSVDVTALTGVEDLDLNQVEEEGQDSD